MSKRWKTRQRNAAEYERRMQEMEKFFDTVEAELKRLAAMPQDEFERMMAAATNREGGK